MLGWRTLLAATLLALPLWAVSVTPAHACSCGAGSVADVVATTDLIVLGTPGDVRLASPLPSEATVSFTDIQWAISVQEYVKGSGPDRLDVRSKTYVQVIPGQGIQVNPGSDPTCGYAPAAGLSHLFFLTRRDDGVYTTGGCAGNQPISAETQASVTAYLDQIREVLRGPTGLPNDGSGPTETSARASWLPLAAGAAVVLASTTLLFLRRER